MDQLISHFTTFGYVSLAALFSDSEMAWITSEFEATMSATGGSASHDGSKRTILGGPNERTEKLCGLMDDPRLRNLIAGLLGDDFNYCSGDGNYFTGDTAWHADGNWGCEFGAKLIFYLDPLTEDTGCLRVLPASHDPDHFVRRRSIEMNRSYEFYGVSPQDFPGAVALPTVPGDVIVFNHDLFHSAWGGGTRRRMFTMNFFKRCTTPGDLALARRYMSVHAHRIVERWGFEAAKGAGLFGPLLLQTAGVERQSHLKQPEEIYDQLFPALARSR